MAIKWKLTLEMNENKIMKVKYATSCKYSKRILKEMRKITKIAGDSVVAITTKIKSLFVKANRTTMKKPL